MIRLPSLIFASLLIVGCSTNVSRYQMPGADLGSVQRLYVNVEDEERQAETILSSIQSDLRSRGFEVEYNDGNVAFGEGDYIFDYATDWHWDLTWYLLELRVGIYEPGSNTLVAQAHSQQTSLVRKSPEIVVERALASLFNDEPETDGDEE